MSTSSPRRSPVRRRLLRAALVAGAVLVVAALLVFEPWKLVVDRTVDDALPAAAPTAAAPGPAPVVPPPGPVVVARGELISHEHASSGSVVVYRLPSGERVLRLEDLDTSDGPQLRVWLTDAPVVEGRDGWYVFDDGRHVDLGELRGNVGSSNYPLPADLDLAQRPSLSIWCDRFDVSFAAAALRPVAA